MDVATTAELEELDDRRQENYRQITHRSFLFAAIGFLGPPVILLLNGGGGLPLSLLAAAGLGLLFWFYVRLVRDGLADGASRRDVLLSGLVAAALTLMMFTHVMWLLIPLGWASAVALSPANRPRLAALCVGSAAYVTAVGTFAAPHLFPDRPRHWYLPVVLFAIVLPTTAVAIFVNRYQRRMWNLHQQAHAAREALARVAVTEERMRFSRDLHDLLGHSLSLIAVKSELAIRMAETDPVRAKAEMADVRRAARDSLREVRAAVRGYRAVELDAELAGVRAVLEAAGVRCETGDLPAELPPDIRAVLAWVIREGATNVIKHSEARRCTISVALYGGSVVLEMDNDGARPDEADAGSGLTGLTERVQVVGGTLTAGSRGRDEFLLRAVIPLPQPEPVAGTP